MSNPTGQRPKYGPPTVFVKMGGDGKPQIENGPSTPSHVKILGPRNGGRQQGRPGQSQQQGGRPVPQMNGRGRQQPQFAPPPQQQQQQGRAPTSQMSAPQLTLCRSLVHGYLKRGLDDLGDDNLKLAALTLDALDQMIAHAAAIAPPPAPRVARQPVDPTGDADAPPVAVAPVARARVAQPRLTDADILAEIDAIDNPDAAARKSGIAPRRVVRAASSIGMVPGVIAAPMPENIDPAGVIDVGDDVDMDSDQPVG